jgi:outer membrane protein assembly factor BamB
VAAGVALVLLVTTFAGVRVFRPTDTVDAAHGAYPPVTPAIAGVYGELVSAPLIVAGRLRVYGAANRVWADGPVDAPSSTSAYWAFRRWPAKLVGVVVTAGDRYVVSQWSDGQVVALRPDTGRVAWRVSAGARTTTYQGRRTGAKTVYDPPDLYTASAGGRSVVVAAGPDTLTGIDGDTGAVLWHEPATGDCRDYFTGPGLVVAYDRCQLSIVAVRDAATGKPLTWPAVRGPVRPAGCVVGRSRCTGLVGRGGGWLIGPDGQLTTAPALKVPGDQLVGRTVLDASGGSVTATDAQTGAPLWSWPEPTGRYSVAVVAVEPDRVHVVTWAHRIVTLELATGRELSDISAQIKDDIRPWQPGYGYAAYGYLVVERVQAEQPGNLSDSEYYFPVPTLLLAGS